ncbi:MAG: DUF3131 domain-containing protein, partial [Paracoccaceae bacterium]
MLLQLMGGAAFAALPPAGWLAAAPVAQPFFMVFDDITADTPVEALTTALAPFSNLGIPVGFILKLGDGPIPPTANAIALSTALRDFLQTYPDLGEAIAWLPNLGEGPPYFQIRNASDVKSRLERFLGMHTQGKPDLPPSLTIAGHDRDGPLRLDAARAAGFRNVILLGQNLGQNGRTTSDQCLNAMPCMRGSLTQAVTEGAYGMIRALRAQIGHGDMVMLTLSLENIGSIPLAALRQRAEALADTIGAEMQADRIFAALPREHVFWFSTGNQRLIGLRVTAPPAGDFVGNAAFAAFQSALATAELAFTVTGEDQNPMALDGKTCLALPTTNGPTNLGPANPGPATCVIAGVLAPATLGALAEAGIEVVVQPVGAGSRGMDANGLLRLPENLSLTAPPAPGQDVAALALAQDIVVSILPGAYATEPGRTALLAMLNSATKDAASAVVTIPDFADAILPADPVYQLMQATRRDIAPPGIAPPLLTDADRAALMQDAKIAWSYFDQMTETATGLCPSTVFFDGDWSSIYRVLTMWDYASLIQATLASHELGLIDDAQFTTRAEAILRGLPAQTIGGLVLPNSEVATYRPLSLTRDYNACDTGRLLIALAELDRHPLAIGLCAKAVANWDLDGTLRDGRLHSVIFGRFVPLYTSHCAHYASRAFRLWGVTAASPYDDAMQGQSVTDARMRLLYGTAQIGAIGAEPLLLEGVELGFSAPTAFLADVLHTAQIRSFTATGDLVCVSEGPMDRAPWFTYQGLRIDVDQDFWDVQAIDPAAIYASATFRDAARIISTKAAFLWAALRPG